MWRCRSLLYVLVAVSSATALESCRTKFCFSHRVCKYCTYSNESHPDGLRPEGFFVILNHSDVGTFTRHVFDERISKSIVELSIVDSRVSEFTADSLRAFGSLETLVLDNAGVTKFPEAFFAVLGSLKTLRLNRNGMKTFDEAEPFHGLHNLSTVDLSFNEFEQLEGVAPIEHLIVRHNKLRSVPGAYQATTIEMADNNLRSLDLHKFQHLKRLNASRNSISELAPNVCGNLTSLVELELEHNQLQSVARNFRTCKRLKHLGLSHNRIGNVDDDAFDCFAEEENLIQFMGRETKPFQIGVDLSFNELFEFNVLAFAKTVQFVDLSSNRITELNGLNDRPVQLREVNLSNNSIRAVEAGFFGHFSELRTLNLSGNQLPSLRPGCLRGLADLRTLDLTSNKIAYIDGMTFHDVPLMEHLYLGGNLLQHFPVQSAVITHLLSVDLDGNRFRCDELLETLRFLKLARTTVRYGTESDSDALHGIRCDGDIDEAHVDVDTAAAVRVIHEYVPSISGSSTATYLTLFLLLLSITILGYNTAVQKRGQRG